MIISYALVSSQMNKHILFMGNIISAKVVRQPVRFIIYFIVLFYCLFVTTNHLSIPMVKTIIVQEKAWPFAFRSSLLAYVIIELDLGVFPSNYL